MRRLIILLAVLGLIGVAYAIQWDWIGGEPVQTNNTVFEWSGGEPYVVMEAVAATTTTTTTTIPVAVANQHQKIIRTRDNAISGIILSGLLLIGGLKCGKRFCS